VNSDAVFELEFNIVVLFVTVGEAPKEFNKLLLDPFGLLYCKVDNLEVVGLGPPSAGAPKEFDKLLLDPLPFGLFYCAVDYLEVVGLGPPSAGLCNS
jgi:hypothetical protein